MVYYQSPTHNVISTLHGDRYTHTGVSSSLTLRFRVLPEREGGRVRGREGEAGGAAPDINKQ